LDPLNEIIRGSSYVSNFGGSSGAGQVLQISAVPEPETYALMLVGLGTIAMAACGRWDI
jgi:hypothetical protein